MTPHTSHLAVIGLGANLGDAEQTLKSALVQLKSQTHTTNWQVSPFYRTAPIGSNETQPDYINGVASFYTDLMPETLMNWLLETERLFGRDRSHAICRNSPRTLDLDLLLYDQISMDTPLLILPHPRLHERAFVLKPLLDILPDCVAPGLGTLTQYLPNVADQAIECIN